MEIKINKTGGATPTHGTTTWVPPGPQSRGPARPASKG